MSVPRYSCRLCWTLHREVTAAIMVALLGVGVLLPPAAYAAGTTGALVIGNTRYSVTFDVSQESDGSRRVVISIRHAAHQVAYAVARLRPNHAAVEVNGHTYDVPQTTARRWWSQLTRGDFSAFPVACTEGPQRTTTCETPAVVSFMAGLPAKVRFTIDPTAAGTTIPEEIRMFSLEEWDNVFREYVSLGMTRVTREGLR